LKVKILFLNLFLITLINLKVNNISGKGIKCIASALQKNSSLKDLKIGSLNFFLNFINNFVIKY
jgi:hypothetical protein